MSAGSERDEYCRIQFLLGRVMVDQEMLIVFAPPDVLAKQASPFGQCTPFTSSS